LLIVINCEIILISRFYDKYLQVIAASLQTVYVSSLIPAISNIIIIENCDQH